MFSIFASIIVNKKVPLKFDDIQLLEIVTRFEVSNYVGGILTDGLLDGAIDSEDGGIA